MTAESRGGHERQLLLLRRWVASLKQLPAVEVIWIEGSLVDGRANPWSDIDLRLAIADDAYVPLWETDRTLLLEGLGEHLVLWEAGFARAVTAEGILVELLAHRSSQADTLELYEWEILFNRLPEPRPTFRKSPERSTAETWPAPAWSAKEVGQWTKEILHMMAITPADLSGGEDCAAAYTLDYLRNGLFRLMYQRLGIRFSKRAKELSRIFPPDFIADLKGTYTQEGESALDCDAIAAALLRTYAALGRHLQALSDAVGGGFEPEWFVRLYLKLQSGLCQRAVG